MTELAAGIILLIFCLVWFCMERGYCEEQSKYRNMHEGITDISDSEYKQPEETERRESSAYGMDTAIIYRIPSCELQERY